MGSLQIQQKDLRLRLPHRPLSLLLVVYSFVTWLWDAGQVWSPLSLSSWQWRLQEGRAGKSPALGELTDVMPPSALLCPCSGSACGSCSWSAPSASRSPGSTSGGASTTTTMSSTGEWRGPWGSEWSLLPSSALRVLSHGFEQGSYWEACSCPTAGLQ